jgi:hypothetical protein
LVKPAKFEASNAQRMREGTARVWLRKGAVMQPAVPRVILLRQALQAEMELPVSARFSRGTMSSGPTFPLLKQFLAQPLTIDYAVDSSSSD